MPKFLTAVAAAAFALTGFAQFSLAESHANSAPETRPWSAITLAAKGQEVFWNAWGGDDQINSYIEWAGAQVEEQFGVKVTHVKLTDTANAVSAVVADKAAGRDEGGKIDLIWINGENFASMKRNDLLFGPFVDALPNKDLVDWEGKPTTLLDFTVPTDGFEAPWGQAQFNFIYDSDRVETPPTTIDEYLGWAAQNPGRFTYPQPPNFVGSTFLKQVLIDKISDPELLKGMVSETDFDEATASVWTYLDALHPHLWRGGKQFPADDPAMRQLMDDGELDFTMSFTPSAAMSLIRNGKLPSSARAAGLSGGTIGNTHFVAIPYNAASAEGAMVLANFLMSAEAQSRKADVDHWGDGTVLKAEFVDAPIPDLGPALTEPDPSWMVRLEAEWAQRYTN